MPMETVRLARQGEIAIATIDNPPVNALGQALRAGLARVIAEAGADPTVSAIVLAAAGRAFIAGADISEFGKPPLAPFLPDVLDAIEACRKPVVAAIQGAALGGGLEVEHVARVVLDDVEHTGAAVDGLGSGGDRGRGFRVRHERRVLVGDVRHPDRR